MEVRNKYDMGTGILVDLKNTVSLYITQETRFSNLIRRRRKLEMLAADIEASLEDYYSKQKKYEYDKAFLSNAKKGCSNRNVNGFLRFPREVLTSYIFSSNDKIDHDLTELDASFSKLNQEYAGILERRDTISGLIEENSKAEEELSKSILKIKKEGIFSYSSACNYSNAFNNNGCSYNFEELGKNIKMKKRAFNINTRVNAHKRNN